MTDETDTRLVRPADLLVAGALLTRLPLPHASERDFQRAAKATWAYPVIGFGLGCLAALVWAAAGWFGLGAGLQAGLALAALVMMSGALHEDGLADTADGFWGGHDPARRLEIMKDSRIGSYGVSALILGFGLRWLALASTGPAALIAASTLSRGALPAIMSRMPSARPDGLARAQGTPPADAAWLAAGLSVTVALFFGGILGGSFAIVLTGLVAAGLAYLSQRKVGGITGDTLGATQQICEIAVFLALASIG